MRAPKVENKYDLTIPFIRTLKVGDMSKVKAPLFRRNEVLEAWIIAGSAGKGYYTAYNHFWLRIHDDRSFTFDFSSMEDMCGYNFENFFDPEEIDNEDDLEIQELFLETVNNLIDSGILVLPSTPTKYGRKYLEDVGWTPMGDLANDHRQAQWAKERLVYGFDERDTWALNSTMYDLLYERLKMFDEVNCIDTTFYKFEYKDKTLTQQECIDRMIELLEPIVGDKIDSWDKGYHDRTTEAMEIFALCQHAMWW